MAYIPPLVGTIGLGELSGFENIGVQKIHTYLQVNATIIAEYLGFYFQGYTGEEIQMIGEIRAKKIETIYPGTDLRDYYRISDPKIATNINFSEILSGEEGWKFIKINPTIFEPNALYLISFLVTTTLIPNTTIDNINIASRDLCPLGPGQPWDPNEKRSQTDQNIEMVGGKGYSNPIAIALSGAIIGEGFADIINVIAPQQAYKDQAIEISANIINQGFDDNLFVKLITNGTEFKQTNYTLIGETWAPLFNLIMPNYDLNVEIQAGHEE